MFRILIRIFGPPGSESVSVIYLHGSGSFHQKAKKWRLEGHWRKEQDPDPDPDPYQNVTDPEHWCQQGSEMDGGWSYNPPPPCPVSTFPINQLMTTFALVSFSKAAISIYLELEIVRHHGGAEGSLTQGGHRPASHLVPNAHARRKIILKHLKRTLQNKLFVVWTGIQSYILFENSQCVEK
jgi:hypothetical protein